MLLKVKSAFPLTLCDGHTHEILLIAIFQGAAIANCIPVDQKTKILCGHLPTFRLDALVILRAIVKRGVKMLKLYRR